MPYDQLIPRDIVSLTAPGIFFEEFFSMLHAVDPSIRNLHKASVQGVCYKFEGRIGA